MIPLSMKTTSITQSILLKIPVLELEDLIVEIIVQWVQVCESFIIHRETLAKDQVKLAATTFIDLKIQ